MKLSLLLPATLAAAAPTFVLDYVTNTTDTEISFTWDEYWNQDFQIHESCNLTQVNQLTQAFADTKILAEHAKQHALRWANSSEIYRRYFGNAPSGEVVGIFENIVSAEKDGVLFRCDNIDGNCKNEGWAGHHRGENATNENVICDLSYTTRLFLSQVCSRGYTVSGSKNTVYWGGDLLHRIWHTDKLGQGVVGHYADTFAECLELAVANETYAVRNSASLRYYALDAYAYDIAVPGVGCTGDLPEESNSVASSYSSATTIEASSTSVSVATTLTTATPTTTEQATKSGSNGGLECHTHANGDVHCA